MRFVSAASLVALFICVGVPGFFAQQANDPPFSFPQHIDVPGQKSDTDWYLDMVRRNNGPFPRVGPSPEPPVLKKGPLAPSDLDRSTYAGFLGQPNTGLIRLLPRELSESNSRKKSQNRPTGEYYSFTSLSHELNNRTDLALVTIHHLQGSPKGLIELPSDHELSVYALAGMLSNLGDVPLEELNVNDLRASFMLAYVPSQAVPVVQCDAMQFRNGVTVDGRLYKRSAPIQVNTTYLLRSINYGQSDVLIGFRVARADRDGSVTIVWKLLKQFVPRKLGNVVYVNNPKNKCPIK